MRYINKLAYYFMKLFNINIVALTLLFPTAYATDLLVFFGKQMSNIQLTWDTYHITGERKRPLHGIAVKHKAKATGLLKGPLDRSIGTYLPESRQGQANLFQGTDHFWKPLPQLLFSIYNHH